MMAKKLNKMLAMMLAITMCAGTMSLPVFAEDGTVVEDETIINEDNTTTDRKTTTTTTTDSESGKVTVTVSINEKTKDEDGNIQEKKDSTVKTEKLHMTTSSR